SIYATVLESWLGVGAVAVDDIFGQSFERLDLVNGSGTGVSTEAGAVTAFDLHQNYPNPFANQTTIRFSLGASEDVNLTVYDVSGKAVEVVANQAFASGEHAIPFDASNLASGVYIYQLKTPTQSFSRQMTVVR
ncbi:MAG: T9SS type A sorting domain-containing protein, partial [Bacteroidota bacterium]